MKKKPKYIYVCGTDWSWEIGYEGGPPDVDVYNSVKALKLHKSCWPSCGIVRVRLQLDKQIVKTVKLRKEMKLRSAVTIAEPHRSAPRILATNPLKVGDKISVWTGKINNLRSVPAHVVRKGKQFYAKYRGKIIGKLVFGADERKCWTI